MDAPAATRHPYLRWTLASLWGWVLGFIVVLVVGVPGEGIGIPMLPLIGIGMGAGVGLAQWTCLRRWYAVTISWLWASASGLGATFSLAGVVHLDPFGRRWVLGAVAAAGAIAAGLWQRRMLPRARHGTAWWVLASALGWALAAAVTSVLLDGPPHSRLDMWIHLSGVGAGGLVLGLVTSASWALMGGPPVPARAL